MIWNFSRILKKQVSLAGLASSNAPDVVPCAIAITSVSLLVHDVGNVGVGGAASAWASTKVDKENITRFIADLISLQKY